MGGITICIRAGIFTWFILFIVFDLLLLNLYVDIELNWFVLIMLLFRAIYERPYVQPPYPRNTTKTIFCIFF